LKVTIIGLDKWGYNQFIVDELLLRNIEVTHIDFYRFKYQYPSFLHRAANFFTKTLFNYNFKREHLKNKLLQQIKSQPKQDVILIIKGDNLSIDTLKIIKNNTHKMITFLNDSMKRYPRMKKVYPYFDKVYSFDPDDVTEHHFNFISNYIYFDYKNIKPSAAKYGVFNISSLDKRSKTMPQFARYFKKHNINYKLIAFTNHFNDELAELNIEQANKIYGLQDVLKMVIQSEILLDLQRPKQKGLSFRIFEGIALKKKIISTNKDLVNYDFYNPNNIAIVDADDIKIPQDFFTTPYQSVDDTIVHQYHISSWVNTVFNL